MAIFLFPVNSNCQKHIHTNAHTNPNNRSIRIIIIPIKISVLRFKDLCKLGVDVDRSGPGL